MLKAQGYTPPATLFATPDTVADASTPAIIFPVLDFNGISDSHADWTQLVIPSQYSGATGFTFSYTWAVDGTDVDNVEIEFRVLPLAQLDVLTADLGMDGQTPVAIVDTPIATSTDKFMVSATGALAKASFGSAVAGTLIVIRATRDVSIATNTDDLQLLSILVTET